MFIPLLLRLKSSMSLAAPEAARKIIVVLAKVLKLGVSCRREHSSSYGFRLGPELLIPGKSYRPKPGAVFVKQPCHRWWANCMRLGGGKPSLLEVQTTKTFASLRELKSRALPSTGSFLDCSWKLHRQL